MKTPTQTHPLAEARAFLAHWLAEARRLPGAAFVFDLLAVQQITDEAITHTAASAATAHQAECSDEEAARLLTGVLADRKVTASEIPAIRRALRLVKFSARHDHDLTERLHIPAA